MPAVPVPASTPVRIALTARVSVPSTSPSGVRAGIQYYLCAMGEANALGVVRILISWPIYAATFASLAGVQLKNPANPSEVYTNPEQAIVRRKLDNSEIKEWEALGTYVFAASKANTANPDKLPARYDATTATFAELKRTQCKGSLCEP